MIGQTQMLEVAASGASRSVPIGAAGAIRLADNPPTHSRESRARTIHRAIVAMTGTVSVTINPPTTAAVAKDLLDYAHHGPANETIDLMAILHTKTKITKTKATRPGPIPEKRNPPLSAVMIPAEQLHHQQDHRTPRASQGETENSPPRWAKASAR